MLKVCTRIVDYSEQPVQIPEVVNFIQETPDHEVLQDVIGVSARQAIDALRKRGYDMRDRVAYRATLNLSDRASLRFSILISIED